MREVRYFGQVRWQGEWMAWDGCIDENRGGDERPYGFKWSRTCDFEGIEEALFGFNCRDLEEREGKERDCVRVVCNMIEA